jgi:glycoprotein endo-alpha-1,2-mannosidase
VGRARITGFVGLAVLAAALAPGSAAKPDAFVEPAARSVAIFYYPWYSTPARDGGWAHWYVDREGQPVLSTPYYPARGLYSSSNAKIVAAQMREIRAAGVGTVVVSWWGVGSAEDERLPVVREAAHRFGLDVAIHLEPYRGRTPETAVEDIQALAETGVRDFYLYDADRDPAEDWAAALAELERHDVRILGHTTLVGRAKAAGFDGLYTYDVVTWNGSTFRRLCTQARRAGLLCAPSVGPGYDARLATRHDVVRPRLHGATYDRMWLSALRARPDLVTITSYNEWQEGTQIEPALPKDGMQAYEGAWDRYGRAAQRAYLHATARWTAALSAAVRRG